MSSGAPGSESSGVAPPAVRALWTQGLARARALSKPARLLLAATAGAGLLIALALGLRSTYEPYAVLFSQLEREDAGAIVTKLKDLHVPYRIAAEGSALEVPEARVHEVRLELASAGLPRGGGVGFESFDTVHLGATEFEQRVLYRRALEGELARTIGGIDAVRSARVHLVMPERSVFASRREPASASVVLKLRGGRTLGVSETGGIVHLVAAAVPGLAPEQVALVTTDGQTLHRPRGAGAADAPAGLADGDQPPVRALESTLEERTRAMLERLLGPGHVDVRVSTDLDLSRVERTEDRYDPAKSVLRSEEATVERAAGSDNEGVAGVPGAESNLPSPKGSASAAALPSAPAAPAGAVTRETHTRNFEIDHVQEKRISTSGVLRRLTVAVVVDGVPGPDGHQLVPRPRAELDRLEALVRSAVGAVDQRGDVVTVESVPFSDSDPPPAAEAPRSVISSVPAPVRRYARLGAVALAACVVLVLVLRRVRSRKPHATVTAVLAPATRAPALGDGSPQDRLREEVLARVKQDPATAALVLRRWLAPGTGEKAPTT